MRRILVVAGLIEGAPGLFLVSRRPEGTHLAGAWEFPGGKIEPGEPPAEALRRELREELGVEVRVGDPFAVGHHVYADGEASKEVILLVYRCQWTSGEPQCLQVAAWQWIDARTLAELPMPPADAPVQARIRRELVDAEPST